MPKPDQHGLGWEYLGHAQDFTPTVGSIVWILIYCLPLGFVPKYRERLRFYERLDPSAANAKYEKYSAPPSFRGMPYVGVEASEHTPNPTECPNSSESVGQGRKWRDLVRQNFEGDSMRSKQGREWEKLSTAVSVITATSAAALAIPGLAGDGAYWLVNCSFCTALGVALGGLILVYYLTVVSGGASDETLGRFVREKMNLFGIRVSPMIPAIIMSFPMSFATYSSLYLLIGTMAMVLQGRSGAKIRTIQTPQANYYLPMIPIGFGLVCLITSVLVCEVGIYHEMRTRRKQASNQEDETRDDSTMPL